MKGELVSVFTKDGYELQGMLCMPKKREAEDNRAPGKALLHIHGLAGNFYENRFVSVMADELNTHGFMFLTVNNRGSGVLSELRKCTVNGIELEEIGGAREIFDDCLYDIEAWIDYLDKMGCSSIGLQGHSFGCHKVAFYQSRRNDQRVKAVSLISPPDVFGYQYSKYGERFKADLESAHKLTSEGMGKEFMPRGAYLYLIDAQTFWASFGSNSHLGIFNYFDPKASFTDLAQIHVPILACYGSTGEPVLDKPKNCLKILKEKALHSPSVRSVIVQGATHRYLGYENQLAFIVRKWLDKVL